MFAIEVETKRNQQWVTAGGRDMWLARCYFIVVVHSSDWRAKDDSLLYFVKRKETENRKGGDGATSM